MSDSPATVRRREITHIAAASVGNLLEWYDFSVYALFAPYIARALLPPADPLSGLAQSLLVFALGAVVRPLGALVLGLYADRRGRGPVLLLTCVLMGAGNALIILDPPYETAGRLSILILCVARVLQGISAGGEIGGAAAFLVENARHGRAGFMASFLQATMGLSNVLGAAVAACTTGLLTESQMAGWGWRVPFVIGVAIVPVGLVLRAMTAPSPSPPVAHAAAARPRSVLAELWGAYRPQLGAALGISLLWGAAPYAFVINFSLYAQRLSGVTPHESYIAALLGNATLIAGSLAAGRAADRFGKRRLMTLAVLALMILPALVIRVLLRHPDLWTMSLVSLALCALVAAYVGVAPQAIADLFPRHVRATGIAVPYNLAVSAFGAFAPAILASCPVSWHGVPSSALYVSILALPALLVLRSATFLKAAQP